jgi:hypothetical protein
MSTQTRLSKIYNSIENLLRRKLFRFQTLFINSLLSLFVGFIFGSVFATFLPFFRELLLWDGFVIFSILLFSEIISYIIYHFEGRKFFFFEIRPKNRTPWEMINIFKTGLLFGLFVDAFKVGS